MKRIALILLLVLAAVPAYAQTNRPSTVVASCDSITNVPNPGQAAPQYVDSTGRLCTTTGGTASTNITQFGGIAVAPLLTDGANVPDNYIAIPAVTFLYQWNGSEWVPVTTSDTVPVVGNVAHDAADSGSPIKIGAKAIPYGTNPTEVTANDRSDLYADRQGVLKVLSSPANPLTVLYPLNAAGESNVKLQTVSAGTKIGVTQVQVVCPAAVSVAVSVTLGFAQTNTPTTTGVVMYEPGTEASSHSGISRGTGAGLLGVGADGDDLIITSSATTGGTCGLLYTYFTIAS